MDDDKLNLLYIENNNANIAIKVNNKLSMRINVKDVIMQGSVWSSLKCTTSMDMLNKTALADTSLQYKYKGDESIPIGVMGFVDDTLGVSECGNAAIRKNAVINSFMETQRLTLSKEKSVVVHIGKAAKCVLPCPKLNVHSDPMDTSQCTKYLGNLLSSKGGVQETIEDRRKKGWGKISQIMGILGEVDMGTNRVEAGLLLRQSILVNSLLYSAEAWSGVSDAQLARLEVVDTALLSRLTGGHSKTGTEFHHLETGTQKLRHILSYRRLMYHHNIISRQENETIVKIYKKQQEDCVKGNWLKLLEKDFKFIGVEMNEEKIRSTPKDIYKKEIKQLIDQAAFSYFIELKNTHKKIKDIHYEALKIQPYLQSKLLNIKEKELLYSLRSHCHMSKFNFKKLFKNNINCRFGCKETEDQIHIFTNCVPLNSKRSNSKVTYNHIYGSVLEQKDLMTSFIQIEQERLHRIKHLLPGGRGCQDPCKFSNLLLDCAADASMT